MSDSPIVYDEFINGHRFILRQDGTHTCDGIQHDWYKETNTGKPMMPKRKNFISLVKMGIREGDYQ